MKPLINKLLVVAIFIMGVAAPLAAVVTPQNTAAKSVAECEQRLLGIPPWYRGLTDPNTQDCAIISPNEVGGLGSFIWRVVLNVIEMAIVATAYLTAFFIMYGGFLYITGGYNPSQTEKARKTILNAAIGLVISLAAIALTNLIFRIIS